MRVWGLVAAGLLSAWVAPGNAHEFSALDVLSPGYPTGRALDHMGQLVREGSDGEHTVRVMHGSGQGSERLAVERLRNGSLDMARVGLASFGSLVPSAQLLATSLPYESVAAYRAAVDGAIGRTVLRDLDAAGFVGVAFYVSGNRFFASRERPIRHASDLQGLRVRIMQRDAWASALERLGARTAIVPVDRVQASFAAGAIDATETNWPLYSVSRLAAVARTVSLTEHAVTASVLIYSRERWQELDDDERDLITRSAVESARWLEAQWPAAETEARSAAEQSGVEIIRDVDRPALRRALSLAWMEGLGDRRLRRLLGQAAQGN